MITTTEYGVNYGRGTTELTDYAKENERIFMLQIEASRYYTPTCIEISPMSFVIYAKEHGVIEGETWVLPHEEIESLEKNSYFIMKDGSHKIPGSGAHNMTQPKPENMNSDLMLYSTAFTDYSESSMGIPKLMNVDDFEAVVINGVRFEFEK